MVTVPALTLTLAAPCWCNGYTQRSRDLKLQRSHFAAKIVSRSTGAGHQASSTLVIGDEEQPIQVGELHPAAAVSHAGQRGRPHRTEEDQVSGALRTPSALLNERRRSCTRWNRPFFAGSVAVCLASMSLLRHLLRSKSDMSRLRLAAGGAILKLAQEPCYHDIITPEQFQLCGLVINVSPSLCFVWRP